MRENQGKTCEEIGKSREKNEENKGNKEKR